MNKNIWWALGILMILVLAGFYLILDNLSNVKTNLQNLESQIALQNQTSTTAANANISETNPASPPISTPAGNNNVVAIPTSIIFDTLSSPLLTPQTKLTVTVQNVSKSSDGTITVDIKVFSKEATSYSAVEPRDLFQIINLEGNNQSPLSVTGQFNSIPPQNAISGSLTFKIDPSKNTAVLQIGAGDQIKYYEFNFKNQTYKEAILG